MEELEELGFIDEDTGYRVLFQWGGHNITPYAFLTAVGVILGLVLFLFLARKRKPLAVAIAAVLSIGLGLLCARAFYVLVRLEDFTNDIGLDSFFRLGKNAEEMGYGSTWGEVWGAAFWGAAGGVALAAVIAGLVTGEKISALLDAFAPGAALAMALSRFGEYSIGEGIGPDVSFGGLKFFPFAVTNVQEAIEYEFGVEDIQWVYPVFLLEGIIALILFTLLLSRRDRLKDGYAAKLFLVVYCPTQILMESLRRDNFLRWLFVRVSQLAAAIVLFMMLLIVLVRWIRGKKNGLSLGRILTACFGFLLLAGIMVAMEFAIEGKIRFLSFLDPLACYGIEALCCAGFGALAGPVIMKNGTRKIVQDD